MDKKTYERLKFLEKKKERLKVFYETYKSCPYLVLSSTKWGASPFWEQTDRTKRTSGAGIPRIMDLPDDLDLLNLVLGAIDKEAKAIDKEFSELLNK